MHTSLTKASEVSASGCFSLGSRLALEPKIFCQLQRKLYVLGRLYLIPCITFSVGGVQ